MHARAAELIATLDLRPHPEGGFYREIYRSQSVVMPNDDRGPRAALTTIYFLLPAGEQSPWHRVASDEVWHLYEGGPLELLVLDASGSSLERHTLSHGTGGPFNPTHAVPAHCWQGARSRGDYALVGCTVAPGFDFADFTMLADDPTMREIVRTRWPDLVDLV